jgi:hypothetical protein
MIRGMMGPALLIVLGILFLLHQVRGGRLGFDNTWPIILLVIGLVLLASSLASRDGHVDTAPAIATPVPPAVPPSVPPQRPYSGQGQ